LLVFTIVGCDNNKSSSDYVGNQPEGSLSFAISSKDMIKARTLKPGLDMVIVSYDISGIGPKGSSFSKEDIRFNSVSFDNIMAGSWAITVLGMNSEGIVIASGGVTVQIRAARVTGATVFVTPLEGKGTLAGSISWPAAAVDNSSIVSTLTVNGGDPSEIVFIMSVDDPSASFIFSEADPGYFIFIIKLLDGDTAVWESVEAVRIISGEITKGLYDITKDDIDNGIYYGDLVLGIESDMENPIDITFDGVQNELKKGSDMTVTALTSDDVNTYQWYISGKPIIGEDSETITIGNSLPGGVYRLYLLVTSGLVVSSNGFRFAVITIDSNLFNL